MKEHCRFCNHPLHHSLCDLGKTPLSNSYPLPREKELELYYPLQVLVCDHCFLVQLHHGEKVENIFGEYAYFSSYSTSWLEHAKAYVEKMVRKLKLGSSHLVVEIASNDGYLLQYFKNQKIPVLGIEPAANVAQAALVKGIETFVNFFSLAFAEELITQKGQADLIVGNNVLAHLPNLNDFIQGLKRLLKPDGTITLEFPHLLKLIQENQFDTIYHEHFSYFSFIAIEKIFTFHRLKVYDVEEIPTHGGSLRIYAAHEEDSSKMISSTIAALKDKEAAFGLSEMRTYRAFNEKVKAFKREFVDLLLQLKQQGRTIVGYGAPAKGNTLLNYCQITKELLDYTVDKSHFKQGRLLPGSHIPIYAPEKILQTKPDYLLILPWNLKQEITEQMAAIREWGGKFIIPIPELQII